MACAAVSVRRRSPRADRLPALRLIAGGGKIANRHTLWAGSDLIALDEWIFGHKKLFRLAAPSALVAENFDFHFGSFHVIFTFTALSPFF